MKLQIGELVGGLRKFREGDRVVVDHHFSMDASVFRRSEQNKPYMTFGVSGKCQLTLIELLLIVAAGSAAVTLFLVTLHRRIAGLFFRGRKKA